jgi:hypothetical protein
MPPTVKTPILALSLCFAFAHRAAAMVVPITACGQTVPDHARGILQNDLDCPGTTQTVHVGSSARLELNGHTITAADNGSVIDVHSPGKHVVVGPGRLVNVTIACGVGFHYQRRLQVQSVDIVSTPFGAIDCLDQDAFRQNPMSVRDVQVTGTSAFGITGQDVQVRNVSVTGSSIAAILAINVKGQGVSIVGNAGAGIRSDVSQSENVVLKNADIRDNAGWGIVSHSIRLKDSTVTGNGSTDGYDLASIVKPVIPGSTCERSLHIGPATPWGICSND